MDLSGPGIDFKLKERRKKVPPSPKKFSRFLAKKLGQF
jgi:hypothetical protein